MELKDNITVPTPPASPVSDLSGYSWAEINAIALSGNAAQYFALGATKTITLTS